jgi:hypothetical protein
VKRIVVAVAALAALGLTGCTVPDPNSNTGNPPAQGGGGGGRGGGSNYTESQQQAIGSAQDYLSSQAFSKRGLIQQLSSNYGEGFNKADAVFAVNHIDVDWNSEAAKSAQEYLSTGHFSCSGLVQQLESSYGEGFTHAQAVYGAKQAGLC